MRRPWFIASLALSISIATLGAVISASADWPSDPDENVPVDVFATIATGGEYRPPLVADGAGGMIAGFLGRAHRLTSTGSWHEAWPATGLVVTSTGALESLANDGAGGVLAAWSDTRNGASSADIYLQRIRSGGTFEPGWPAGGCALSVTPTRDRHPVVVPDGTGGAIVVWLDAGQEAPALPARIFARRIRANGNPDPAWPDTGRLVWQTTAANGTAPVAISDGAGGVIVVWGGQDILAHRVRANGQLDPAWPAGGLVVCGAPNVQERPSITTDGAGGAIVAWLDRRNSSDYRVYAHRVRANGIVDPDWLDNGLSFETIRVLFSTAPRVISDGAGGAFVAWSDFSNADGDIHVQRVQGNGEIHPDWPIGGLPACAEVGAQTHPALVRDGADGVIVVWSDLRSYPSPSDLYATRLTASGGFHPMWSFGGEPVSTASGEQVVPEIVSDGAGGAIVSWQDTRNTGSSTLAQLYAQRIQYHGVLGGTVDVEPSSPPTFTLDPVHPNPARGGSITVRFALSGARPARIEVLDVAGRRVVTRDASALGPGRHSLRLDLGAHCAPGVYLVRLAEGDERRTTRVVTLN